MANNSYVLSTLRNKAYNINYKVEKGFVHYRDVVDYDCHGKRHSGYDVLDLETGFYVPGCYDEHFDHLWDLDDVANFLKDQYAKRGLDW